MLHASLGLDGMDDAQGRRARAASEDNGAVYMAESDPTTMSFDEIDGTDESLKAHDIVVAGMERAQMRID